MENHRDIVETALAAGNLTTFSNALKAAGLVDAFKGPGTYTVFAPTDAAFSKLPVDMVEGLMKDKKRLAKVLNFHVLRGKLNSWDLPAGNAKTVEGNAVRIGSTDESITVDDANVTHKDIHTSNGVIHAIDTVMMPGEHAQEKMMVQQESAWAGKRRVVPARKR